MLIWFLPISAFHFKSVKFILGARWWRELCNKEKVSDSCKVIKMHPSSGENESLHEFKFRRSFFGAFLTVMLKTHWHLICRQLMRAFFLTKMNNISHLWNKGDISIVYPLYCNTMQAQQNMDVWLYLLLVCLKLSTSKQSTSESVCSKLVECV